jgi:hypothetical protein
MSLTVAYLTNRHNPEIRWFADSLRSQMQPREVSRVIIVDFWAQEMPKDGWSADLMNERLAFIANECEGLPLIITPPMPNVWNGPYRLPKSNHFAAAATRNTALCLCDSEWLAYVDDLSVLVPEWMQCVREAMQVGYVALGSYKKVHKLQVENGNIISFERPSVDTRIAQTKQDVTPCDGGWLYGCSLAGPTESFLKVGGWPSDLCDGLSSEDCCMGKAMRCAGIDLRYDRRMMTLESEEGHGQPGPQFMKADKGPLGTESDKSHNALRIAEKTTYFHNRLDIPTLRKAILAGQPFPITDIGPNSDWFDGAPISEAG